MEARKEMILAGDIGGTHTRLAVIKKVKNRLVLVRKQIFSSRNEPGIESVVQKFLPGDPITRACFGVAGPVRHGRCEATNLPWVIDSDLVARQLNLSSVGLINDIEAQAYGIADLEKEDFDSLNPGMPDPNGNCAVISAGTGLGEVGMFRCDGKLVPFASEGGHSDFAPRNSIEVSLLDYLLQRHPHVSVERVVSGQGLFNIYQFFKDTGRAEEPYWLAEQMLREDPPAVISRNGLEDRSPLCRQALDLFVSLYGAEAGNLALKLMATGGVYLGGGIAPKIVARLKEPIFMNAFAAKGRMKPLLLAVPVCVIRNPDVALLGAARYALRQ